MEDIVKGDGKKAKKGTKVMIYSNIIECNTSYSNMLLDSSLYFYVLPVIYLSCFSVGLCIL